MPKRSKSSVWAKLRLPAVIAGLIALIVGSVVWQRSSGSTSAGGVAASGADAFAHVHGLGIDPADGALYAGTHYGVFRVEGNGEARQIGPTRDYMGFTVAGPNRFVASGHPGVGEKGPHSLGLLESADAGRRWSTLSLRGQADFHSLDSSAGLIYGYSGGALMVSGDGKSWEQRSRLALTDFAVTAEDPSVLIATTPQGVQRSQDGGRSFSIITGAPRVLMVNASAGSALCGVDQTSRIYCSSDAGSTWEQRGQASGTPQALVTTATSLHLATTTGLHDSNDQGHTFTLRRAA